MFSSVLNESTSSVSSAVGKMAKINESPVCPKRPISLKVSVRNRQQDLKLPITRIKKMVSDFLASEGVLCSEVALHFVSKKQICALHNRFFKDPTPTDCISLPLDSKDDSSPFSHFGEVFVCPQAAIEYVSHKKGDPLKETLLYIVHGLLHLLGYDDLTQEDRRFMRKKERFVLDQFFDTT